MFKSIKKALATLSVLALLVSNVQVVFAQTFNDVPTDAWYYDYVEQLVSDGVIDAGDTFRPNAALNRAELVKIVITAVDGLADYEAPATPTFDDVAPAAWYYDYVEAAVQLGIVGGYTDAAGNLTGKFGPGDTVNRAQATKILVNAFAVPTTLTPASAFPDVTEGAWYYDYVVTAYNQSILDGYANGNFGPADPVTRAQVAKLVVNSQNPVERAPGEGEGEGEGEGAGVGALEASLNDTTAPSSTLPQAATSVRLVSWDFTAADDDVSITNLVVTRGGVGKVADWDALYLYDGTKRLTTGRTINSDTNTSTFAVNILVAAGTTTTITLVGDVAAPTPAGVPVAGASNQHYFYVASSADVTSNAASTSGDFPVAGNTFTIGGNTTVVNNLIVAAGTAPSQPTIGQLDAEVASIKLTAGATNDIAIHQLALTQGGSLGTEKMENLRLLRGTDEVATATGFDGDRVTFVLATPYVIPKGQNKTFYVHTDINGGRTTDTIKLYLDENTDMVAIDQQYGYGAVITNNFTSLLAASLTLKGGDVTVADNGPAAHQVAQNATNAHLLDFAVTAARDLTVRDTDLVVGLQYINGGVAGPNLGTALASTTTVTPFTTTQFTLTDVTGLAVLTNYRLCNITTPASDGAAQTTQFAFAGNNLTISAGAAWAAAPVAGNVIELHNANNCLAASLVATVPAGNVRTANYVANSFDVASIAAPAGANITAGDTLTFQTVAGTTYAIVKTVGGAGVPATAITTNSTSNSVVANGATISEVDPYILIKNVKVIDIDSGSTLQGPLTNAASTTTKNGGTGYWVPGYVTNADYYYKDMTEDFELTGGETRHIGILVDTDTNLPAGYNLFASIRFSNTGTTSYLKDMAANEFVATSNIVGAGATALRGKMMTSAANSLTVGRAATPTSQTYVKGDDKVPALGMALQSGDAGDITVKKLTVRVYGNVAAATPWAAILGDTAANTLVSSVTLYDGNDVVDGPRSLTLVDTGGDGNFTAGADYYKVLFDNLNLKVAKGSTKTYTAKAKLLNTMAVTSYVTLDMVPTEISAEDADANTITPSGGALNGALAHTPLLTVLTSGTLSASSEGNPDAANIVAGSTMMLVGKYRFTALREGFTIDKLTVMNDAAADFTTAVSTASVSKVSLKYKDVNGATQTANGSLTSGVATFSGLTMYVPSGTDSFVEIYADVSAMEGVGEILSGQTFRLGMQSSGAAGGGNTVSTFNAVGVSSSTTLNATGAGTDIVPVANAASVNNFVVRRSVPTFAKASGLPTTLIAGENRIYGFTVSADNAGAVSFGRLSMTVSNSAGGILSAFKLYRGSTLVTGLVGSSPTAFIFNGTTSADLAPTGPGTIAVATTADTIVAFRQEETIGAGSMNTYYLDATRSAAAVGDSVQTKLAIGDEATPVLGIVADGITGCANDPTVASTGNGNTGHVSDTSVAFCALFTGAATDFVDLTVAGLAQVWSDKSADAHLYPTIAAGVTTDGTGSYDWTNGYLLKLTSLTSQTLSK